MKKTIKEEILEALTAIALKDEPEFEPDQFDMEAISTFTSIAEKHIKIARLEGFIQGLKDSLKKGVFPGEISEL